MDMGKQRKGFIVERMGKLYVRVNYTDQPGKRRELMRRAQNRQYARELKKQLVKQLDSAEDQRAELDAQKLIFAKVAGAYEAARLIPAQYVGDWKVSRLRGLRTPKSYLKRLVAYFGAACIRSITYSQVDKYRLRLLAEGLTIASASLKLNRQRAGVGVSFQSRQHPAARKATTYHSSREPSRGCSRPKGKSQWTSPTNN
jgi:hypothetical protein